MSLYFALLTVENNTSKKPVKFQGDVLNFYDFIQVFVFTTNHHLKQNLGSICGDYNKHQMHFHVVRQLHRYCSSLTKDTQSTSAPDYICLSQ